MYVLKNCHYLTYVKERGVFEKYTISCLGRPAYFLKIEFMFFKLTYMNMIMAFRR